MLSSLAAALEDEDDAVRTQAAQAVGMLGGDANSLAEQLIETLTDRSPEVRAAAAFALGLVAPRDERVVAALVKALADVDTRVRRAAGSALNFRSFFGRAIGQTLTSGASDKAGGVKEMPWVTQAIQILCVATFAVPR